MSVLSLCDKICNVYSSQSIKNALGGYGIQTAIKYRNLRCRITQTSSLESFNNGMEREVPNEYRIYFGTQIILDPEDYVVINNVRYDVLYIDKCYKRHMQIDVKRNPNQIIESVSYLILSGQTESFITLDDGSLIILEL